MDIKNISKQLKLQIENLLNDLLELFPEDQQILLATIYFKNKINEQELLSGFEKWVYPWKKQILAKDEDFFRTNNNFFGPLPQSQVDYVRNIYFTKLTPDEKETIWQYFTVYIKLIEKYRKLI